MERRRSSAAERLICNQLTVRSNRTAGLCLAAGVPERLMGPDCKSGGARLRGFESLPLHQFVAAEVARIELPGAHVAQLAERVLGKDEVTGSSPVVGF